MKCIEFGHGYEAYRVHYSRRDESFTHAFGIQRDHSWGIMFLELWSPVSDEWLNINLSRLDETFLQKTIQRIEDVEMEAHA
jgi:hypothetical protein